ncbi:MAG: HlyD family efflux transporter periplasmic adaptor subunit [Planctomycetota bacterium]
MPIQTKLTRSALIAAVLTGGVLIADRAIPAANAFQAASENEAAPVVIGTTMPNEDLELAFPTRGRVTEVLVKPGEIVKAGQPLIRLDDRTQQVQYKQAMMAMESEVPTRIALRELQLDKAELDLNKRLEQNKMAEEQRRGPVFNADEIAEYTIAVEEAKTNLELERIALQNAEAEVEAAKVIIDQLLVSSPVDGIVRDIAIGLGEAVDERTPAVIVVQNNPLKVRVNDLTPAQVSKLELGQAMEVRYADGAGGRSDWLTAKLTFIDPKVDFASGRHFVKLELENPEGLEAGRRIELKLPPEVAALADGSLGGF